MIRFLILLALILGPPIVIWWQYRAEVEQPRQSDAEQERQSKALRVQAVNASLVAMAANANADSGWEALLTGGKRYRTTPIFSAELQKLWIVNRPVLFVGDLVDVVINQNGTHQIVVEHNERGPGNKLRHGFIRNDLRVSFMCSESIAESLAKSAKAERRTRHSANTAITGLVERIESATEKNTDGTSITVFTGFGRCVSAMYLEE